MANDIIRPSALETERTSPVASEFLVTDNETSVAKVTIEKAVQAGRPAASKSEAETGSDANKVMTPLTVQQKLDYEIGRSLASKAQGDKADTAIQPNDLGAVATSNDYDDLDNKPTLGTAASENVEAFATAEQGGKADTAWQPSTVLPSPSLGDWDDETEYAVNDRVFHDGNYWIAKAVNTNSEPEEGADWTLFLPGVSVGDGSVTEAKLAAEAVSRGKLAADISATADRLITVGAGGDFATLNDALAAASRLVHRDYKPGGFKVEVRLLTGFVMAEQVVITNGLDLSFVTVTSVDTQVVIQRSALTLNTDGGDDPDYPAFSVMHRSKGPELNVLFDMDSSGPATGRTFLYCAYQSEATISEGKGCLNPGGRGIEARIQAKVYAYKSKFTGCGGRAFYALHFGEIFAEGADVSNSGSSDTSVYALLGGKIHFADGKANNHVGTGPAIWANRGGIVYAYQAEANDAATTYADSGAVLASDGGEVQFENGQAQRSASSGISAYNGGKVFARNANASQAAANGFVSRFVGELVATSGQALSCGAVGAWATDAASLTISGGNVSGSDVGARSEWSARLNARSMTGTGCINQGAVAQRGGYLNAGMSNFRKGGSDSTSDIVVATNGKIDAAGATGGLSQTANQITSAGLINV